MQLLNVELCALAHAAPENRAAVLVHFQHVAFGFFPKLLTEKIEPSAAVIVNMANGGNQNPPGKPQSGMRMVRTTWTSETE